jgi:hypothetical protein
MSCSNITFKKGSFVDYYNLSDRVIKDYISIDNKTLNIFKKINLNKFKNLSTNYFNSKPGKLVTQKLISLLENTFSKVLKEFNYKEIHLMNFWFQKYKENNFHDLHTHLGSGADLSFILYLDCTKNSSNTLFYFCGYPYTNNSQSLSIKPEKGVCLIFPSYLPHLVEANKDTTRYIVAGNLKIN